MQTLDAPLKNLILSTFGCPGVSLGVACSSAAVCCIKLWSYCAWKQITLCPYISARWLSHRSGWIYESQCELLSAALRTPWGRSAATLTSAGCWAASQAAGSAAQRQSESGEEDNDGWNEALRKVRLAEFTEELISLHSNSKVRKTLHTAYSRSTC